MMRILFFLGISIVTSGILQAVQALPADVKYGIAGGFSMRGVTAEPVRMANDFTRRWRMDRKHFQNDPGFPKQTAEGRELAGRWNFGNEDFWLVKETFRSIAPHRFQYRLELANPNRITSNMAGLQLTLPLLPDSRIVIDNLDTVELPEKHRDFFLYSKKNAKEIRIVSGGRETTLSGAFQLSIWDGRKYGKQNFTVRLEANENRGTRLLELTVTRPEEKNCPLNLAGIANRGFRDEIPGDAAGGWTDQGPANDLRNFPAGPFRTAGVEFNIINPKQNSGRSAVVLSGRAEQKCPVSAEIQADGLRGGWLNLLHAGAWLNKPGKRLGTLTVLYRNGESDRFPILNGRDIGNWWAPRSLPNGRIGWRGENPSSTIGLYVSQFALKQMPLQSVRFECKGPSVWMIAAATVGNVRLDFAVERKPEIIRPGAEWLPTPLPGMPKAGSPLDFSWLLDAPAGKYGRVICRKDGCFAFENAPERTIRFYGVNLCFDANFLKKNEAEQLAETLARQGYNSVRIHHQDGLLTGNAGTVPDPELLDRLDWLLACLKKRGIYVTSDLYASRRFSPADAIPGVSSFKRSEMKQLIPFERAALENWKSFVRNWLTHVNPYTGLAWGEDPAVFSFSLLNECSLLYFCDMFPEATERFTREYHRFLAANKLDTPENQAARGPLWARFLNEKQNLVTAELIRFLRKELGVKTAVTAVNSGSNPIGITANFDCDYVDRHDYWDHPLLPEGWGGPMRYLQRSAIRNLALSPRRVMAQRIFGKPFMMTEINYCYPNRFRAEAGPLLGACAALQNWAGMYRFAWSHERRSIIRPTQPYTFDIAYDPVALAADRIVKLLFVRGDVQPAPKAFAMELPRNVADRMPSGGLREVTLPEGFGLLGLFARVGVTEAGRPYPGSCSVSFSLGEDWRGGVSSEIRRTIAALEQSGSAVSSTGEIQLNAKTGTMTAATSRSEVIAASEQSVSAKRLRIENQDGPRFRVAAAASLDAEPLGSSRRILFSHITDALLSDMEFTSSDRTEIKRGGRPPLLLHRNRMTVTLRLDGAAVPKVEALDSAGQVLGTVPSEFRDGILKFRADNDAFPQEAVIHFAVTRP